MHAVLLLLLLAARPPESTFGLSLADAVRLAERHSPVLAETAIGIPTAEAGVRAAGALPNPTIGLSVGRDEPRWIETVEQRLPLFGQRSAAMDAAAAEVDVARAELEARRLEIRIQVRRAYAALSLAQARVASARQSLELAATTARMARDKYDIGLGTELEVEQAELAHRRSRQDLLERAGALSEAQLGLAEVLGEGAPAGLEATDPLYPLAEPPPLEVLVAQVERHPAVLKQVAEREAALARARNEQVALRPLPAVTFELQEGTGGPPMIWLRGGVTFDLPLLSQRRGAIAQERSRAEQAEAGRRTQAWGQLSKLRAAYARFETARQRAHFVYEDLVPGTRRVVELTRLAYQLGRAPLLNVLQTQGDLSKAFEDGLDAYRSAWDALADLEEASGGGL